MKIEAEHKENGETIIVISEFYSGLTLRTREGKDLNICLRDYGFDMNIDGGKWHHIHKDKDFDD